jgi:outer membrane murein-binding lipoprotein Lpp
MNWPALAILSVIVFTAISGGAAAQAPVAFPSARNGLNEQLDRLSATIDRRVAHGRMSLQDAERARREVNNLQAETSDDRVKNGGQLTEADRFRLQARISQLKAETDQARPQGVSRPTP